MPADSAAWAPGISAEVAAAAESHDAALRRAADDSEAAVAVAQKRLLVALQEKAVLVGEVALVRQEAEDERAAMEHEVGGILSAVLQ